MDRSPRAPPSSPTPHSSPAKDDAQHSTPAVSMYRYRWGLPAFPDTPPQDASGAPAAGPAQLCGTMRGASILGAERHAAAFAPFRCAAIYARAPCARLARRCVPERRCGVRGRRRVCRRRRRPPAVPARRAWVCASATQRPPCCCSPGRAPLRPGTPLSPPLPALGRRLDPTFRQDPLGQDCECGGGGVGLDCGCAPVARVRRGDAAPSSAFFDHD
jgi:hypothetical protein